jgi:hypothetical protein
MKTLEDFKIEERESWKNFSSSSKIVALLYFHEPKKGGLGKEEIRERLRDVKKREIESSLKLLKKYYEVTPLKEGKTERYILSRGTRELFRRAYSSD